MTETITLRDKPALQLKFHADRLEIVDRSDPKNSGTYPFNNIKNAKVNAEGTDWFVSLMSFIATLFVGGALWGKYKNKAHLTLTTDEDTIKIWLVETDLQQAERVAELINTRRTAPQQRP
ncbi:MAG: hypothetical protein WBM98_07400 [Maribacter sp.]|uniref:hypothetical protein n=1 Tax=Maribacter sp. TaxID=1897614 RepID=UPI003C71ADE0